MVSNIQQVITSIVVFCIVLFLYLHIQFHLKASNDLEIYEIEEASKEKKEEICDLRQPVLFDFPDKEDCQRIINTTNKQYLLDNYPVFEIKIRDNSEQPSDTELYVPLHLHVASKLFEEDKNACYFSEGNNEFLHETGVTKSFSYNDEYLRPFMVSNCYYDVLFSSSNVETPFRYDINYRNYYLVTQGSITVKLSPPKSSKYLHPINDYEMFEFRSPINPWNPQSKYKVDFDKIKCLEIVLTPGKLLYIPAYWWYSFKFEENSSVSCFKYRTYMNNLAIAPQIALYALQNQNVERKFAKQIDIKNLSLDKNKDNENENNRVNDFLNTNNDFVENDELTNNLNNFEIQIPDILIPKEEPEPLPNIGETFINNDNIASIE